MFDSRLEGRKIFESSRALAPPYAAPSVLHIPVLFSIGPPLKLAPGQAQTQIMDWVFTQEVISGPQRPRPNTSSVLNAGVCLGRAAIAKHASRRAACSRSGGRLPRATLVIRVPEERLFAYVGSACDSTDVTFSRPSHQQSLRTPKESPSRGTRDQRGSLDFPPVWRSHETHPAVLIWLWTGEDK